MQSAAKVGLLLVVFIGLIVGGYSMLGKSLFGESPDTYYADFEDATGITPGTRILMAGVKVGTVGPIKLVNPKKARLTLLLDKGTALPKGTVAQIPSSLIGLGDTPLALIPPVLIMGGSETPHTVLLGTRTNPLDSIFPNSKDTVAELTRTITAMRKILEDKKLQDDVHALMASTTKTIDRFGKLADTFQATLAQNQGGIQRSIALGSKAVADVQKITAAVVKLLDEGSLQSSAKSILAELMKTSKRADQLVASMNDLVNDPRLRGQMNQTMKNVAEMTESSKAIVANVGEMTTTGKAIANNGVTISANAIELTAKANKIADGAIEIEEHLNSLLKKVEGIVGKSGKAPTLPVITPTLDLTREAGPAHLRADVGVEVGVPGGKVHLGLRDAFEANQLTIQYEKPLSPSLDYRVGIFGGRPGFGVDYRLTSKWSLRTDAWDLNNPRLDARLGYSFGGGFVGWLGLDRIFRGNTPSVGFGIRY